MKSCPYFEYRHRHELLKWPTKNAGLFKPEKFRNIFKETTCHGLFHVSRR
jgi:hypothetical protein